MTLGYSSVLESCPVLPVIVEGILCLFAPEDENSVLLEDKVATLVVCLLFCACNNYFSYFSSSYIFMIQFQGVATCQCIFLPFQLIGELEPVSTTLDYCCSLLCIQLV